MDWQAESAKLRAARGHRDYQPLTPFVSRRTVERSIWYEGQLVTVYAQGGEVGNVCSVWEGSVPREVGPPPHIHHHEHEIFFVLEGAITAWVEGEPLDASVDTLVFLPCGRIHWFESVTPVARMLSFTVTASPEFPQLNKSTDLFRFIGRPATSLTLPSLTEEPELPEPREILRATHAIGSDFPDLAELGWRRGYGGGVPRETRR